MGRSASCEIYSDPVDSVYLNEIEEADEEERLVLTGRFDGDLHRGGDTSEQVTDLPFDAALAWARERAALVYVDAEDGRFNAGSRSAGHVPDLPAEVEARIRTGGRRARRDWWLDRTEADEPMRYEVEVALSPGDLDAERRHEQRKLVEGIVRRMREEGFERVDYSAERLEAGLREIERQWQAAGQPEVLGWNVAGLEFEITAELDASEHRSVTERLRRLISEEIVQSTGREPYRREGEDLDGRWDLDIDVHPPGYDPPPLPI